MSNISFDDFLKVDFRSGTIVKAEEFPRARNPSYKIWADFGAEIGVLQTSAQVTANYRPDQLLGMQIVGCINLGEKNIAGFQSQFLLVGFADNESNITLVTPNKKIANGQRLH